MSPAPRQLQDRIGEIERLIPAIEQMSDEKARQQTRDMVQAILEIHGTGLECVLEMAARIGR
jgi:hypothetical protein